MSVFFEQHQEHIIVSGKTFVHKDRIKALGAKFDFNDKTWILPNSPAVLAKVVELCQSLGGGSLAGGTSAPIPSTPPIIAAEASQELFTIPPSEPTPSAKTARPKRILALSERVGAEATTLPTNEAPSSEGLTVAQVIDQARQALRGAFPQAIWVIGEIQNLNRRGTSCFFSLAEAKDQGSEASTVTINATVWSNALQSMTRKHGQACLDEVLGEGLKGRFLCQVNLYRDRGSLTLNIVDLDPQFTKGALALQRELLLKELRQKGLDQLNKQLRLPYFPLKIGLISADDSRAKSDFLHQLWSYQFPGDVLFYQAAMQGEAVSHDVCLGIKLLEPHCDVIVITRGGGSAADLRWFDAREIAIAIAQAKRPIIAAIGHHDDVCVAEEVCFRREKTPTAAADFLVARLQKTRDGLMRAGQILIDRMRSKAQEAEAQKIAAREKLQRGVDQILQSHRQALSQWTHRVVLATQNRMDRFQQQLLRQDQQLCQCAQAYHHQQEKRWQYYVGQIRFHFESRLSRELQTSQSLQNQLSQKCQLVFREYDFKWTNVRQSFELAHKQRVYENQQNLMHLTAQLKAADPRPWLQKGWTQLTIDAARSGQSRPLTSIHDVEIGDVLKSRMMDGNLSLEVTQKSQL